MENAFIRELRGMGTFAALCAVAYFVLFFPFTYFAATEFIANIGLLIVLGAFLYEAFVCLLPAWKTHQKNLHDLREQERRRKEDALRKSEALALAEEQRAAVPSFHTAFENAKKKHNLNVPTETSEFTQPLRNLIRDQKAFAETYFGAYLVPGAPLDWKTPYHSIIQSENPGTLYQFLADLQTTQSSPVIDYFLKAIEERVPYSMTSVARFEGTHIVAAPGKGKTNLLKLICSPDLEEVKQGKASIVVLDAKGDLIGPLRNHTYFLQHPEKLVVLDPDIEHPIGLNPFQIGDASKLTGQAKETFRTFTIDMLEYIFSGMMQEYKFTSKQSTCFVGVVDATLAVPNPTFKTLRDILNGWDTEKYLPYFDHDQQHFVTVELKGNYSTTRGEITSRMDFILKRYKTLAAMLQSPKTTFNIAEEMNAGKVILINTDRGTLGDGCTVMGRIFIAMVRAAAAQRSSIPEHKRMPVYFYLDEAHDYIASDTKVSEIIDQCRSFKIAIILAHQRLGQLKGADVEEAVANCAIKFANHEANAVQLSKRFGVLPEQLNMELGNFALRIRSDKTIFIKIPEVIYPRMSPEEQLILKESMWRYTYTPEAPPPPEPAQPPRNPDTLKRKRGKKL